MHDVESGIGAIVRTLNEQDEAAHVIPMLQPGISAPQSLPDYVSHREDATHAGMMSAQVIVIEFENAAKEIEALGEELKAAQIRAEKAQAVLADALKKLAATARAYRSEAAEVFNHVEHVTAKANEAVALCAALSVKTATK